MIGINFWLLAKCNPHSWLRDEALGLLKDGINGIVITFMCAALREIPMKSIGNFLDVKATTWIQKAC